MTLADRAAPLHGRAQDTGQVADGVILATLWGSGRNRLALCRFAGRTGGPCGARQLLWGLSDGRVSSLRPLRAQYARTRARPMLGPHPAQIPGRAGGRTRAGDSGLRAPWSPLCPRSSEPGAQATRRGEIALSARLRQARGRGILAVVGRHAH